MKTKIVKLFSKYIKKGDCPRRLSLSVCVGIFVALSPFMGLHTVIAIFLAWLLGLNFGITFVVAHFNNFLTVGPLLVAEYGIGHWLLNCVGVTHTLQNPHWMSHLNGMLNHYCGFPDISFWAFFIGANALAVSMSVGLYPVVKWLFLNMSQTKQG